MSVEQLIKKLSGKHKLSLHIERGQFDNWWFVDADNDELDFHKLAISKDLTDALQELCDRVEQHCMKDRVQMLKDSTR